MNYYEDYSYISNSMLSEFERAYRLTEEKIDDIRLSNIFAFGNLVDAMITEPHLIDYKRRSTINTSTGEVIYFDRSDFSRAVNMRDKVLNHPSLKMLIGTLEFQKVMKLEAMKMGYNGNEFTLPTRCKFDGVNIRMRLGIDIKTTACTSLSSFKESISFFSYDRQAAFYMDIAGLNRFMFIGIPKSSSIHDVFLFVVQRDDDVYIAGKEKYSRLAFLYRCMVYGFDNQQNTVNLLLN